MPSISTCHCVRTGLGDQGKTILIVDDEPGIARTLAHLLRRSGHTVETAAIGRLALAQCQDQDCELILCDLRVPKLDGPGFYQELWPGGSSKIHSK